MSALSVPKIYAESFNKGVSAEPVQQSGPPENFPLSGKKGRYNFEGKIPALVEVFIRQACPKKKEIEK